MSRLIRISVIFTLLFSVSSIALDEDRNEVANKFYSDLTNIIESNKNNPLASNQGNRAVLRT